MKHKFIKIRIFSDLYKFFKIQFFDIRIFCAIAPEIPQKNFNSRITDCN